MKKFFKKPFNIVSLLLAVLGIVGIIVMLVVPHGAKYTKTVTEGENKTTLVLTLKNGKMYSRTKLNDKWLTDEAVEVGEYTISKGKLSYKVPLTGLSVEYGEINAFRLIVDSTEDVKLTCNMTIIFFVIACVMTVVGVAGMVSGAITPKKKKK